MLAQEHPGEQLLLANVAFSFDATAAVPIVHSKEPPVKVPQRKRLGFYQPQEFSESHNKLQASAVRTPICLSIYRSIDLSIHPSSYPSIHPSIYPTIGPSMYLPFFLLVYLLIKSTYVQYHTHTRPDQNIPYHMHIHTHTHTHTHAHT